MTPEELWLRFLAAAPLSPDEKGDLLRALESDPGLRRSLLADSEIDGLLKAYAATPRQITRTVTIPGARFRQTSSAFGPRLVEAG